MAVFAYLAIARPVGWRQRDFLMGMFWPDLNEDRARTALRKALHRIREALGQECILTAGTESVRISEAHVECDAWTFNNTLSAGRLRECLDCYRGDLLPGYYGSSADAFERWLAEERAHYQSLALGAAWRLVEFYENNREFTSATQLARVVARLASTDERVLRRVITMLVRLGDRAGAADIYRKFSDNLWRTFQTRPSRETVELMDGLRL